MNESIIINISKWIIRLAYINVLWVSFTILGLFLFGWAPATVSSFTIMKRWINNEEFPILPYFWHIYKKEFVKSNVSGLTNVVTLLILLTNIYILSLTDSSLVPVFMIGNWSMVFLFSIFMTFFFPMYTLHKDNLLTIYKKTLVLALAKLPVSILILLICVAWGWILFKFPGFILLFSISVPIFLISFISYLFLASTFIKINNHTEGEFNT